MKKAEPSRRPDLSPAEVTDLCSTAKQAWDVLPPRARQARFKWRGQTFVVSHSTFRLQVRLPDGTPVAARYD
jgi:hypothetical protein